MKFVEKPFCFNGDLKVCIVDGRITKELEESLVDRGIKIIKTPKCEDVYNAISYHPDIQFFNCGNGKIIVAPNLYDEYIKKIEKFKSDLKNNCLESNKDFDEYLNIINCIDVIKGENALSKKYPKDISYNVCIVGKYALHNFEYTDEEILKYIEEKGFEKINIKQGYSKCSICVVDDKSIITSDKGIVETIKENEIDIDCLLIKEGNIDLFDMNYGFIGGCTGLLSDKEIGFLGDVESHPDFEKIEKFLDKREKKIVSLSKDKLLDLGSIIPIICG